jgi:hypothetical protein
MAASLRSKLEAFIDDSDDIDWTDATFASCLFGLFQGCAQPDIYISFANKVSVQQVFTVKVRER